MKTKLRNEKVAIWKKIFDTTFVVSGLLVLICLIFLIGFYLPDTTIDFVIIIADIGLFAYLLQEFGRWFIVRNHNQYFRERWIENLIGVLIIFQLIFPDVTMYLLSFVLPKLAFRDFLMIYMALMSLTLLLLFAIKLLRYNHLIAKINLHPGAIIAISFFVAILVGSFLLMLPRATPPDNPISYVDALFTSASAVCVTGLTVVDTGRSFTTIGHVFIAFLIQIGGLGVMTLTTFFAFAIAGGLSLRVRIMMRDLLSQESVDEVKSLLLKILGFTLLLEIIGSFIMYFSMGKSLVNFDKVEYYYSLFHAISAFCNAGFSLYSDNLMYFTIKENHVYIWTIVVLVVIGGLGFTVIMNLTAKLLSKRRNRSYRLSLTTKLTLLTSGILVFGGTALIMLFEPWGFLLGDSFYEEFYHATFISVCARTAGFNTVSTDMLSHATLILVMFLMWVGASPGSTGGGIKTTTFAVTIYALYSMIVGKERIEIFKREIHYNTVKQAFMVVIASIMFIFVGSMLLVWFEPNMDTTDLIFEVMSAVNTVGLSRGVTPDFGTDSKVLIVILMFVGRVGVLTFLLSLHIPRQEPKYKLPTENVIVG
ncbi:MAG: hypothetical protein CVV22_11855 [Ignavibacteriae bacterium HGW-Ignavibacteriae-1]|jgi:potassium uptake TrkH family protein|nr:MAG: hypothetical protein CVV22_11855 [Ignavibacteriae bacterium HGW-Ignavibacteriae-1]